MLRRRRRRIAAAACCQSCPESVCLTRAFPLLSVGCRPRASAAPMWWQERRRITPARLPGTLLSKSSTSYSER